MKVRICLAVALLSVFISVAFGQKMDVKIIQRQSGETDYSYVVPGHFSSNSNGSANCSAYGNTADCFASSTTNGYVAPPREVSYSVTGATFSLLLPDGRVAIVNCVSKFKERMAGPAGNHRSCRTPLVDNIEADFKGKKAKLYWPVSLDGKKFESETYKILAVLPK
jgi:hypothetical protein